MAQENFYDVLGVSKDATQDDIKKAFRKKAAEYHPDRNKDPKAPEQFKKVNEAYQVLSDDTKRKRYDQFGAAGFDPNSYGGQGGGFEFDFSDIFSGGFESVFGEDNPFGDIFGGTRKQRSNRGSDVYILTEVTLEDVIQGPEKQIKYDRKERCKSCKGMGGEKLETCNTCKGAGRVAQVSRSMFGNIQVMRDCVDCNGSGKKIIDKCKVCKGDGTVSSVRSFKIRIPKGIESGMNLRFTGEGNFGNQGGDPGDLFIEIRVKQDKQFVRNGDNLFKQIDLPIFSLILGDEVELETYDGPKKIKIPAGTDFGEKLVLKELGIPNIRTKKRGDIIINIHVETPKNLSKEEVDLYSKLKSLRSTKTKKFW